MLSFCGIVTNFVRQKLCFLFPETKFLKQKHNFIEYLKIKLTWVLVYQNKFPSVFYDGFPIL